MFSDCASFYADSKILGLVKYNGILSVSHRDSKKLVGD